jgi:prolipoprotein diacylglyceryltransferase
MSYRRGNLIVTSIGRPQACLSSLNLPNYGRGVHRGGDVVERAGSGSPQTRTRAGTLNAMIPTLGTFWGLTISTHDALVGAGLVAAVAVFGFEKRRRAVTDERLWVVVALALAWGAVFARLGTWVQHVDLSQNDALVQHWFHGSRSILGGLTGAYLGALFGKRVTGYRERTGALFAPAVAAGMAIGRIGCMLTESPGTATGQAWGVVLNEPDAGLVGAPANVPLHPSFLYEIVFHALALALIWRFRDQLAKPAGLFTLYLGAYAVFRFLAEFVRGNEVAWAGLTRPQLFLLVVLPLLLWRALKVLSPPAVRHNHSSDPAIVEAT